MKKRSVKIWGNKKGTALLTALLVMGILTSVSIAISTLVVREIVSTRLALDSAKAYYSAESGVELALLKLKENLPGYEASKVSLRDLNGAGADFDGEYTIVNKASVYPYFDSSYVMSSLEDDPKPLYAVLGLNESITIPLFTVDKDGREVPVHDFVVQYFVDFKDQEFKYKFSNLTQDAPKWDILRWKIYGMKKGDVGVTEAINDFTAVTVTTSGVITNASLPSWFGSKDCNMVDDLDGSPVECGTYPLANVGKPPEEIGGQLVYDMTCSPTQAREFYRYDGGFSNVENCWSIYEFLSDHDYNYLTLTNYMNPAVFKSMSEKDKLEKSKLYFRVIAGGEDSASVGLGLGGGGGGDLASDGSDGGESGSSGGSESGSSGGSESGGSGGSLVREYADIVSTGLSGDASVTLNFKKKRDSYLPVLNFALYHTGEAK